MAALVTVYLMAIGLNTEKVNKMKAQLIAQLYSHGTSRNVCPIWLAEMLKKIKEAQ